MNGSSLTNKFRKRGEEKRMITNVANWMIRLALAFENFLRYKIFILQVALSIVREQIKNYTRCYHELASILMCGLVFSSILELLIF